MIILTKTQMSDFAKEMADNSKPGEVFALKGTLGVGKSFFAKHFINALTEKRIEVLSPTFNLVYSYQTKKGEVFHFDLYRLKDPEELENIGFFDALSNGICLIEWPENAGEFLPSVRTEIEIKMAPEMGEEAREIVIRKQPQKN